MWPYGQKQEAGSRSPKAETIWSEAGSQKKKPAGTIWSEAESRKPETGSRNIIKLIRIFYKHTTMNPLTIICALPQELQDIVFDYAGTTEYWKRRFSNDVLIEINKGYRMVGMFCPEHWDNVPCECEKSKHCLNCFSYGTAICSHTKWDLVSYEKLLKEQEHPHAVLYRYLPWDIFRYNFIDEIGDPKPRSAIHRRFRCELYQRFNRELPGWVEFS